MFDRSIFVRLDHDLGQDSVISKWLIDRLGNGFFMTRSCYVTEIKSKVFSIMGEYKAGCDLINPTLLDLRKINSKLIAEFYWRSESILERLIKFYKTWGDEMKNLILASFHSPVEHYHKLPGHIHVFVTVFSCFLYFFCWVKRCWNLLSFRRNF